MARRAKRSVEATELNMTAMIDVVFQLLIFFIVTAKPEDVMTNLDVFRPAAQEKRDTTETPNMIKIQIFPDGFLMNDKKVQIEDMARLIGRLASLDVNQTILIMCSSLSKHSDLVRVLDLCSQHGLRNLSVVSTN